MVKHEVYWGSHGCDKNWPHKGACRCSGCVYLQDGQAVYGDDAVTAITYQDRQRTKGRHSDSEKGT